MTDYCEEDGAAQRYYNEDNQLLCATCDEYNLHLDTVSTYIRVGEDGHGQCHVVHSCGTHRVVDVAADEIPGYRRNAVVMMFWCEHCTDLTKLMHWEHKGLLFIRRYRVEIPLSKHPNEGHRIGA